MRTATLASLLLIALCAASTGAANALKVVGCNVTEQKMLEEAVDMARTIIASVHEVHHGECLLSEHEMHESDDLSQQESAVIWKRYFGHTEHTDSKLVVTTFDHIYATLDDAIFVCDTGASAGCLVRNFNAFTVPALRSRNMTVRICPSAFEHELRFSRKVKAGGHMHPEIWAGLGQSILHEMAHLVSYFPTSELYIEDIRVDGTRYDGRVAYSLHNSQQLAVDSPVLAISNADNYALYAMEIWLGSRLGLFLSAQVVNRTAAEDWPAGSCSAWPECNCDICSYGHDRHYEQLKKQELERYRPEGRGRM